MEHTDRLGTHPVGKLLVSFAVPAMTGMIVNALYSLVDRLFVGRGVGEIAVAGLTVAAPIMTIISAFAMLFGIGAANAISVSLGRGEKETAQNILNHCFFLLIIAGIAVTAVGEIFLRPLLILFGAQSGSASMEAAAEFTRIIFMGSTFSMMSFGFAHCTRAQGFPKVTMVSMIIGAVVNTLLDPLFIFVFHMGVRGAATATITAQFISTVWILRFVFSKKPTVRLRLSKIKPSASIVLKTMSFGMPQFFLQLAMGTVNALYNSNLGSYGRQYFHSSSGGDTALAGFGVVASLTTLLSMPVFGMNQAAQPILGFNYGAKKYDRVMKAYLYAITAATVITVSGFLVAQLFSRQIVLLFLPDATPELLGWAPGALRNVLLLFPIVGFQIVSANYFVVTGKPKISMLLSLSRQALFLAPCIVIFSRLWGLDGIVWAAPVSDFLAVSLTSVMIFNEISRLRIQIKNQGKGLTV